MGRSPHYTLPAGERQPQALLTAEASGAMTRPALLLPKPAPKRDGLALAALVFYWSFTLFGMAVVLAFLKACR